MNNEKVLIEIEARTILVLRIQNRQFTFLWHLIKKGEENLTVTGDTGGKTEAVSNLPNRLVQIWMTEQGLERRVGREALLRVTKERKPLGTIISHVLK